MWEGLQNVQRGLEGPGVVLRGIFTSTWCHLSLSSEGTAGWEQNECVGLYQKAQEH